MDKEFKKELKDWLMELCEAVSERGEASAEEVIDEFIEKAESDDEQLSESVKNDLH